MHYLLLLFAALSAQPARQLCAQIDENNRYAVACIDQQELAQALESNADKLSARKIISWFDAQRKNLNLSDDQALVVDQIYRAHGRNLNAPSNGVRRDALTLSPLSLQRVTDPIPAIPNTLITDPRNSYRGATDPDEIQNWDPGCNTEINELYGPPVSPYWPIQYACNGYMTPEKCKNCCKTGRKAGLGATGTYAERCVEWLGAASDPYAAAFCALSAGAAASFILIDADECISDHCETTYFDSFSSEFSNASAYQIDKNNWTERPYVKIKRYSDTFRMLTEELGRHICLLRPENPLYSEIPTDVLLRIAYAGTEVCDIKDYRVMDKYPSPPRRNQVHKPTVPVIGRVYFDSAQGEWYLAQEDGGKIWLRRTTLAFMAYPYPPFTEDFGRSIGWENGAKIMASGDYSPAPVSALYVIHEPWMNKVNHQVLARP